MRRSVKNCCHECQAGFSFTHPVVNYINVIIKTCAGVCVTDHWRAKGTIQAVITLFNSSSDVHNHTHESKSVQSTRTGPLKINTQPLRVIWLDTHSFSVLWTEARRVYRKLNLWTHTTSICTQKTGHISDKCMASSPWKPSRFRIQRSGRFCCIINTTVIGPGALS